MRKKLVTLLTAFILAFTVFAVNTGTADASSSSYWLKVNKKCNVVNVYKKIGGHWKPYKVMVCSAGKNGATPSGTFYLKKRWRWHVMMGGVYGQYVTQINGNYLFHSVPYGWKNIKAQKRDYYKMLGQEASHGCVRLCTMDAKWIYRNCPSGTKVSIYSSSTPGPLGKPKVVPMKGGSEKYFYDPTDVQVPSKYFGMTGPVIQFKDKPSTFRFGANFKIMKGVVAKSPYTYQDLTSSVKVSKLEYSKDGGKTYVTCKYKLVNTQKPGKYRITYSCYNKYCGEKTVYRAFVVTIKPAPEPVVETEVVEDSDTAPVDEEMNVETEDLYDSVDDLDMEDEDVQPENPDTQTDAESQAEETATE